MTANYEPCGARSFSDYSTTCDLQVGHTGEHASPDPFDTCSVAKWTGDANLTLARGIFQILRGGFGLTLRGNAVTLHMPGDGGSVKFSQRGLVDGVERALAVTGAVQHSYPTGPKGAALERAFWIGLCAGQDVQTLVRELRGESPPASAPGPCGPHCGNPTSRHEIPCVIAPPCTARCSNPTCETGAFCVLEGPHAVHGCADCGTAARDLAEEASRG